jgi:hypothetical protein
MSDGYENLKFAAKKHDITGIRVYDSREYAKPRNGPMLTQKRVLCN